MRRVCTVIDRFDLPGKGTAVTCIAEDDSLKLTPGASILLKRPGLPDLQTEVLEFEVFRNDWSPHKPRNFGLLLPAVVGVESVPSGSEVFADV